MPPTRSMTMAASQVPRWMFAALLVHGCSSAGAVDVDGHGDGGALLDGALETSEVTLATFAPRGFRDVGVDHWARPFIDALSARGVVAGYPDGTFGPERRLSRGELAALLAEGLELRAAPTATGRHAPPQFSDTRGHWAESAVGEVWRTGAMAGYPDGTFRPQATVSRVEVIAALDAWLRAQGLEPSVAGEPMRYFEDANDVPRWASAAVARALSSRIPATGGLRRRLRPLEPVTRAEAVAMLHQTLHVSARRLPLVSRGLQGVCRNDDECATGELCERLPAAGSFCTDVRPSVAGALPVLMYHDVVASEADATAPDDVTEARFRAQMRWLAEGGYAALTSGEAIRYLLTGRSPYPGRPLVLLTFDDGYLGNYERAWPILRELGLRATYFVHTDFVGTGGGAVKRKMSWEQLAEVEASGVVEVHSHTQTHPRLAELDEAQISRELHGAAQALFSRGRPNPRLLAYPFGSHDARVRALARGYHRAAFPVASAPAATGGDLMAIPRIGIGRHVDLETFASFFRRAPQH